MNLFEKIDLYYKKAQELKTDMGDEGTTGKPIVPSKMLPEGGGYPSALIRAAAKSALTKLVGSPLVPMDEKKDINKLGDLLRDFLNNRFTNKDLNYHWASYLAALMNKVNGLIKVAAQPELGDFYKSLFAVFSGVWDEIAKVGAWASNVGKPAMSDNVGVAEDPWAKKESPDFGAIMKKREEEALKPGGGLDKLKTSRNDRLKKLAVLLKKR